VKLYGNAEQEKVYNRKAGLVKKMEVQICTSGQIKNWHHEGD